MGLNPRLKPRGNARLKIKDQGVYKNFLTLLVCLLVSMNAVAEDSKQFNNWLTACDNLGSCMAVGVPAKTDSVRNVFIKIIRDAAEALPKVIVVADKSLLGTPGATLTLAFDYPATPIIHTKFLSAGANNSPVKAMLSAQETQEFMASLHKAKYLLIRVNSLKATSGKQFKIALAGVAKTLTYMNDRQQGKQNTTDPTMPKTTFLIAQPMRVFDSKLPSLPAALASYKVSHDCSDRDAPAIVARLSPTIELWGLCKIVSTYNLVYAFFIVENGKAQPAQFAVPPGISDLKGELGNPSISNKDRVLSSFYKRNNTADCGVLGEWVWDGKQFQLLNYRKMDDCRGVFDHEDWPVLYRQQIQQ